MICFHYCKIKGGFIASNGLESGIQLGHVTVDNFDTFLNECIHSTACSALPYVTKAWTHELSILIDLDADYDLFIGCNHVSR